MAQFTNLNMKFLLKIILLLLNLWPISNALAIIVDPKKDDHVRPNRFTSNDTQLTEEVYQKCWSFMKHSRAFKNFTYSDAVDYVNDVMSFEAPDDLVKRFPYYFAGYDFEGRPVWIAEMGKYKIYDLIEDVTDKYPIYEKIGAKAAIRVAMSFVESEKKHPGKEIREYVGLIDAQGFDISVMYKILAHPESIDLGIKVGEQYLDLGEQALGQLIVINVNYAAKMAVQIVKPIVGELMERIAILGTNKYKWRAELRRYLPEKTIPSWYGGSEDFKPLAAFG